MPFRELWRICHKIIRFDFFKKNRCRAGCFEAFGSLCFGKWYVQRGYHIFLFLFRQNFLSHSAEKRRRGTLYVLQNLTSPAKRLTKRRVGRPRKEEWINSKLEKCRTKKKVSVIVGNFFSDKTPTETTCLKKNFPQF